MARTLLCEIVTPERIVYHNEAQMVIAPAVDGEIGILPLHAPLVTTLKAGEIRVKVDDKETDWIATSGGYLQVHEDKVTVARARRIQRFLSQPFHVAEQFTGMTGKYVKLEDTIKGFKEIVEGKHDDVPEQVFRYVGTIEEALEAAEKLAATA